MTIETMGPIQSKIKIDGEPYVLNIREYESFINQCRQFMEVDCDSFQAMTQIISDQLIDGAKGDMQIQEIRVQLKFLREIGFFLKGIVSPVTSPDQD
ncbi:MAG TPA: hypothetical protein VKB19_05195 [Pedobacter sp.]|nr:hypothetical protein [Pedobacter sp.]